MAPKPRPVQRKLSTAGKDGAPSNLTKTQNSQSMPPPPVPTPAAAPPPQGLLVPEAAALASCLKTAAIKTGQVIRFYSDTQKLYAPYPPRAMTASLGRELERYDQLCDAMQSHLNRAINVLKRDLERERQRLKAEEEAAAVEAAKAAVSQHSPTFSPVVEASDPMAPSSGSKGPSLPLRRQSTISLSSLQRPAFPHKLDLSSPALRLNPEDLTLPSGMASPVMLAPKSSVPQLAPDFPFGGSRDVTIDLTLDDDVGVGMPQSVPQSIDPSLGNSADKPIELLDIDVDMDIFGDTTVSRDQHVAAQEPTSNLSHAVKEEPIDFGIFNNIQPAPSANEEATKANAELLASLHAASQIPSSSNATGLGQPPASMLDSGPSPGSLLADLEAVTGTHPPDVQIHNNDPPNFNLNLDFLKEEGMMDMHALFTLDDTALGQNSINNAAT